MDRRRRRFALSSIPSPPPPSLSGGQIRPTQLSLSFVFGRGFNWEKCRGKGPRTLLFLPDSRRVNGAPSPHSFDELPRKSRKKRRLPWMKRDGVAPRGGKAVPSNHKPSAGAELNRIKVLTMRKSHCWTVPPAQRNITRNPFSFIQVSRFPRPPKRKKTLGG